ncbi:MAG: RodZ domain-containing protein [Bryobacteraceae bacterium]
MDSIAEIVRRARKERGLTLDEVAASTRINRKYLEAIESGDRTAIPGGFFYKSFVRQYAAALATDSNKVVDEVDQVLDAEEPAVPAEQDDELLKAIAASAPAPERSGHRWVPSTFGYVILLILALIGSTGAYMWWHRTQESQIAKRVGVPVVTQAPSAPSPKTETAPPAATPPPAETPAPAEQPKEEQPAAPAADTPAVVNSDDKITLDIAANELTWISLTADGKYVFSGLLKPGESKTFAAKENARLRIGNAGGLDVKFNGKPTGPIGPKSQVRTVNFTPTEFRIESPVPPAEQPG